MRNFGSGVAWGTPGLDAYGNAYATPSAFQFGILQDIGIDMSFDEKFMYGSGQFPVDMGRGKGKISLKAKFGNFNALAFSAAFFGIPAVPGLITSNNDLNGMIITAQPTVIVPGAGQTFFANLGVRSDANGTPMIRVAANPVSGQYTTDGNGSYSFAAADVGKLAFFDYQLLNATSGQLLTMRNMLMGTAPSFRLDFSMQRNGKTFTLSFPKVVSNKLALSTKQDDFMIPEIDMSALADDNGFVFKWSASE